MGGGFRTEGGWKEAKHDHLAGSSLASIPPPFCLVKLGRMLGERRPFVKVLAEAR